MRSTELKVVVSFPTNEDYNKGMSLIRGDIAYEYSGFPQAINFYIDCEFSLAHRRFVNAGMIQGKNFSVHA